MQAQRILSLSSFSSFVYSALLRIVSLYCLVVIGVTCTVYDSAIEDDVCGLRLLSWSLHSIILKALCLRELIIGWTSAQNIRATVLKSGMSEAC